MSRYFTTLIAAVAMLGFVGAASVHAQPAPKNTPQADQNRNTDPMGKKDKKDKKADKKAKDKKSAVPKGKNPPQADDNTEADPAGKKKN
ncbi:MAG TPA: hypothetical protein PL193_14995 [Xanthobacteraceae bacterium]|nr:hypothetical protein [Xanthobacteraceae bacterium]